MGAVGRYSFSAGFWDSICELKHTVNPFSITKRYADDLRRKLIVDNAYSRDLVDRHVGLDAFWS